MPQQVTVGFILLDTGVPVALVTTPLRARSSARAIAVLVLFAALTSLPLAARAAANHKPRAPRETRLAENGPAARKARAIAMFSLEARTRMDAARDWA
ncbi:MAG TPA: hypothetical protein VJY35_10935, partial [Candidatus Eisenbacteria bacterium]|nr:hypothetical protein [Candidatus Eisenbacteria bacterium]